ncbi:MAG: hypothetical protein GKR89_07300 [Candidatus Latescibacteria bacterium]|nr:hypothetical protein [Candidatus Latescibacterota bacterium]
MLDILRRFGWTAYDHLGGLVATNLLWTLLSLPWLALGYALVILGGQWGSWAALGGLLLAVQLVLLAPPSLVLFAAAWAWAHGRDIGWRHLLVQVRRHGLRAQGLGLILVGASALLVVNMAFYQSLGGMWGLALGGTMFWFQVALWMVGIFLFPVLLTQEEGVWGTLRQSFVIMIDNIRMSLGLLLGTGILLGLGAASGIGLFCGVLGAWALLVSICLAALVARYRGDEPDDEPPRSWREMLKPWEA